MTHTKQCASGSVVEHLLAKEGVAGSIPVSRFFYAKRHLKGVFLHKTSPIPGSKVRCLACRLGRCFCFAEVSTGHPQPVSHFLHTTISVLGSKIRSFSVAAMVGPSGCTKVYQWHTGLSGAFVYPKIIFDSIKLRSFFFI